MSTPSRSGTGFRPDLEGLRGVAILLVLACHAAIPGAGAGFIGVDVFFVLSGFLITGLLVDEWELTGRIDLAAFYVRRARRILPAAAVVLVATLLAAMVVMSPLDLTRVAGDALAAGISVANVQFALSATDYFAPTQPSPMLHYWSLSVEEQFYLFWPALLILATRRGMARRRVTVLVGGVLVLSLLACVALSSIAAPWAYFSLPARAWQLAAGGTLALAARGLSRFPWPVAATTGWVGVVLIAASMVAIEPTTSYPGIAATVPTLGTLALIAGGMAFMSPGRMLLASAPLRSIGRISYSLYLWHWPVLVLGAMALAPVDAETGDATAPIWLRLALIGVSIVLAAISWRLIEEPFRAGRLSRGGRRHALAMAIAALLSITVTSTALSYVAERDVAVADGGTPSAETALDVTPDGALDQALAASPDADAGMPAAPSTADPGPLDEPLASGKQSPAPTRIPAPRPPAVLQGPLPRDLRPTLAAARDDTDRLLGDGCALALGGTEPPDCVYGDRHGTVTVALVGDSHAMNWFPAFHRLATRHHWRLIPLTKFSCVFVDMRIWSDNLGREYTECETWRGRVVSRLREIRPDLTVISSNKWFPPIDDRDGEPMRQGAALARLIERIPGKVAILVDTPRSDHDVPACLARHRDAVEACTTPKAAAFGWRHRRRELEAHRISGAPLIDLSKTICPTNPCPAIIGKRMVFRDHHHLTATFAASLATDLGRAVVKMLPG